MKILVIRIVSWLKVTEAFPLDIGNCYWEINAHDRSVEQLWFFYQ